MRRSFGVYNFSSVSPFILITIIVNDYSLPTFAFLVTSTVVIRLTAIFSTSTF